MNLTFDGVRRAIRALLIPEIWTVFFLLVGDTPLSAVGIPIAWRYSGAAAIAVPLIVSLILHRQHLAGALKRGRFVLFPTLAMGVILAASLIYTPSFRFGAEKAGEFWGFCVVAVILGALIAVRERHRTLLVSFAVICFGVAILGYVEWFTNENLRRLAVLGGGPNVYVKLMFYGGYSALLLVLRVTKWLQKCIWGFVSALHLMPLLMTGSRGGLIATLAALGLVGISQVLRRSKESRNVAAAVFVALVLVVGSALVLPNFVRIPKPVSRYESLLTELPGSDAVGGRVGAIKTALEGFRKSPILGLGSGGFSSIHPYKSPHNIIAEVASETGIAGLAILVALGVVVAVCLARIYVDCDEFRGWHAGWLFGMLVFALVTSQISGALPDSKILFFIGGIIGASPFILRPARDSAMCLPREQDKGDISA